VYIICVLATATHIVLSIDVQYKVLRVAAALEMEVLEAGDLVVKEVATEEAEAALVVAEAEASTKRTQRKRRANDLHIIIVIGKPDQRRRQFKSTDDGLVKPAGDCYFAWCFWLFVMEKHRSVL